MQPGARAGSWFLGTIRRAYAVRDKQGSNLLVQLLSGHQDRCATKQMAAQLLPGVSLEQGPGHYPDEKVAVGRKKEHGGGPVPCQGMAMLQV